MHVLSSFQRTGLLGGYFLRLEPCVRRHQANLTRIPNPLDPVNTFFQRRPRQYIRQDFNPSPQPSCAALLRTLAASPLGLGPQGLAGLGCRLPGALENSAAQCGASTRHPGGEAATVLVMPVRPARLSRLAGNPRGVNPLISNSSAALNCCGPDRRSVP